MKKYLSRELAFLLIICMVGSMFAGCGNKAKPGQSEVPREDVEEPEPEEEIKTEEEAPEGEGKEEETEEQPEEIKENNKETEENNEKALLEEEEKRKEEEEKRRKAEEEAKKEKEAQKAEEEKRLAEQKNSFSMMYYLAITAEEIRISKNNRLVLEEIYTSLLNDINPEAIDETTQYHLQDLRDIIGDYINISTKRERLQFMYNQKKATTIREVLPDPLAVLSVNQSMDWMRLAFSAVYTIADSLAKSEKIEENRDKDFLMSGWDLDDEEVEAVQRNRDRAFDYMVDMVQEYKLDGKLTLNEKSVEKFAEICDIESIPEKIRRLNSEEETYKALGNYWLELADCYFQTAQYKKCLECVDKYKELSTDIFRKDYGYARILPKAIVAAQNEYAGIEYENIINGLVRDLLDNTEKSEEYWAMRYFAAQAYLDLYAKTDKRLYLNRAYEIAYDNVAILLDGQRKLNATYMAEVEELTVEEPDYRFLTEKEEKKKKNQYNEEKKKVKDYNKALKKARKTELPSMYKPLIVNCELLFALAEEKDISKREKKEIEAILQSSTNGTFISKPINDMYSFGGPEKYSVSVTEDEIIIPADLLTAESEICLLIDSEKGTQQITDCEVKKVERNENDLASFSAYISSEEFEKVEWSKGDKLTIIICYHDVYDKEYVLNYKVNECEKHWYGDKVGFEQE